MSELTHKREHSALGVSVVIWCVILLSCCTISPPEDFRQGLHGVRPIVSSNILSASKLLSRVGAVALLAFYLLQQLANPKLTRVCAILLPILLFVCWGFASSTWSALPKESVKQCLGFAVLILIAITIAVSWKDEQDTSRLLFWTSWTLFGLSSFMLCLRFGAPQYGALTKDSAGLFHSTSAGATASAAVMILLMCALEWRWVWARRLAAPALLAHMGVLLVAGNRLSLLITLLMGSVILARASAKQVLAAAVVTAGLIGTLYLVFDPSLILAWDGLESVGAVASQGQSHKAMQSFSGRTEMWEIIWKSYCESPWKGHGYFVSSSKGEMFVWYMWGNWTAHNWLLQLLVTTGLIGAFLLIGGKLILIAKVFRRRFNSPKTTAFLVVMLIWFTLWGLLNSSYLGPLQPESVVFAIVCGLASYLAIQPKVRGLAA